MTKNSIQNWDNLSKHFNTYTPEANLGVLANIEQTWEVLEPFLKLISEKQSKFLDFGCGTGALCNKVLSNNITPVGYDPSEEMIRVARENSPNKLKYISGKLESIIEYAPYDLVLSLIHI